MYSNPLINTNIPQSFSSFQDVNSRKRRHTELTQEGVVVNTFIKESESDSVDLPSQNTSLPKDMFEKKEKISGKLLNSPTASLIAAPLAVLGVAAALSLAYKRSFLNKYKTPENMRIPPQGRLVAVNNDNDMALLMLVQDPSWKNLQVATAVIAASATAFVMKNVVDGFKEVIVKKKAADIKRDKEEKLIDIETRSFSGKNQIIRSLISQKAQEMNDYEIISKNPENVFDIGFMKNKNNLAFTSKENLASEKKDSSNKTVLYAALGIGAVALTALFTKSIFKNLGAVAKELSEKASEAKKGLKADLTALNKPEHLEEELSKSKISDKAKDFIRDEWNNIHNPSGFAPTPEFIAGQRGKTGFTSIVLSQASAFIYTMLINKTPQSKTLATVMCTSAALGYAGEKVVEGVKEVQVEKANADTEVKLQDRLVQVELQNFYKKKSSYIQPLMEDYREKLKNSPKKEEVKKLKENVLSEIKNGPPFVYS